MCQGNLVGPEDGDDSDVEVAPGDDDHELNYEEHRLAASGMDQLRQANSVFNERHLINTDPFPTPPVISFASLSNH